jgi:hypothetical protein
MSELFNCLEDRTVLPGPQGARCGIAPRAPHRPQGGLSIGTFAHARAQLGHSTGPRATMELNPHVGAQRFRRD